MATSWQDSLIQFNPYVEQVPVETYAQVGMLKQQKYDQGVQAVQGLVDSIGGLPVANETQKQYLNQKLGQLTTEINKVAGADFSQTPLIKSISGLAGKIPNDPIVRNAVASATKLQSETAKMEKAKTEGKSSPYNEIVFQDEVAKFTGSQDVNAQFNSSYQEFYDVDKVMREAVNAVRGTPSGTLTQNPYRWDAEKNTYVINEAMIEEEAKGVDPQKIRDAVATVLNDPRAASQIAINAKAELRGVDKTGMFDRTKANYQNALGENQVKIDQLQTIVNNGSKSERDKAQSDLASLKSESEGMLLAYNQDIDLLDKDPENYKIQFYTRNFQQRYANAYSYINKQQKILANPLYESFMKNLDHNMDIANYNLKVKEFEYRQLNDANDRQSEIIKAGMSAEAKSKTGKPGTENSLFNTALPDPINTAAVKQGSAAVNQSLSDRERNYMLHLNTFVNDLFQDERAAPYTIENGNITYRTRANGFPDSAHANAAAAKQAAHEKFVQVKMAYDKGEAKSGSVRQFFDTWDNEVNQLNSEREQKDKIEARYAPQISQFVKKAKSLGIPESIEITVPDAKGSHKATFSQVDLIDFNIVDTSSNDVQKDAAKARLKKRLGDDGYNDLAGAISQISGSTPIAGTSSVAGVSTPDSKIKTMYTKLKALNPDAALAGVFEARESDYNKMNSAKQSFSPTFKAETAEQRGWINSLARSVLSNKTQNNGGLEGGVDADDVLELLDDDEKAKNVIYKLERDRNSNESFLTLGTGIGKDRVKIKLTDQELAQIPGVQLSDPFQPFKDRFLGRKVTGTTKEDAFPVRVQIAGGASNFKVKCHLKEVDGAYEINLFVYDKSKEKWVVEGQPMSLSNRNLLTEDEVMSALDNISEDNIAKFVEQK